MKIRRSRKTRKRGGMDPLPYYSSALYSNSSSNLPPPYNQPPTYTPESRVIETQTNFISKPESRVIETQTNSIYKPESEEIQTQTNNNNNHNISNMTEEQILEKYTLVYETISSKADAIESTALFKEHLTKIKNPFAIYLIAHMTSNNTNYGIYKDATLYAFVITRNSVHLFHSTFFGAPVHPSYGHVLHFSHGPTPTNKNTITAHDLYQFKKPLDSRLIRMFQSISASPVIGQQNTTVINMPGCQPCTTGGNAMGVLVGQFTALYRAL